MTSETTSLGIISKFLGKCLSKSGKRFPLFFIDFSFLVEDNSAMKIVKFIKNVGGEIRKSCGSPDGKEMISALKLNSIFFGVFFAITYLVGLVAFWLGFDKYVTPYMAKEYVDSELSVGLFIIVTSVVAIILLTFILAMAYKLKQIWNKTK